MRTKIYVGVLFETEHYNFNDATAKALAASVQIVLEREAENLGKLIGGGHLVTVYDTRIQERVQTGTWNRKVDK